MRTDRKMEYIQKLLDKINNNEITNEEMIELFDLFTRCRFAHFYGVSLGGTLLNLLNRLRKYEDDSVEKIAKLHVEHVVQDCIIGTNDSGKIVFLLSEGYDIRNGIILGNKKVEYMNIYLVGDTENINISCRYSKKGVLSERINIKIGSDGLVHEIEKISAEDKEEGLVPDADEYYLYPYTSFIVKRDEENPDILIKSVTWFDEAFNRGDEKPIIWQELKSLDIGLDLLTVEELPTKIEAEHIEKRGKNGELSTFLDEENNLVYKDYSDLYDSETLENALHKIEDSNVKNNYTSLLKNRITKNKQLSIANKKPVN